jgi:aspartate dehydrogenase
MVGTKRKLTPPKRKVGILGFGALGQHLYDSIIENADVGRDLEVAFVWNRSVAAMERVPENLRLERIEDCASRGADVVVEVCHPSIAAQYGGVVMKGGADFVVGSPTCFSDAAVESSLRSIANANADGDEEEEGSEGGALYVPVGALWGASDLQSAANRDLLVSLTITMKKHPAMINLTDPDMIKIKDQLCADSKKGVEKGEVVLYEGPVRGLCPLAPNNVNTMACTALACHTLGFDNTVGRLVADTSLTTHEIVIEARGRPNPATGQRFELNVTRSSPAPVGAVTSKATYGTFLESLLRARGRGRGLHFV